MSQNARILAALAGGMLDDTHASPPVGVVERVPGRGVGASPSAGGTLEPCCAEPSHGPSDGLTAISSAVAPPREWGGSAQLSLLEAAA